MTKKILLSALIGFLAIEANAQGKHRIDESAVPKPALNSFHAKFPDAKVDFWEMEGNDYEVMFSLKGVKMESVFSIEGAWIESETWLKENELPPAVMTALTKSHLENWKIVSIEKVSTPHDAEFYEIDLSNGDTQSEIFYDHDGVLLADDRWLDEDSDDLLVEDDENMDGNQD